MKNYLKGIEKVEDSDVFNRILYNLFIDKNTRVSSIRYMKAGKHISTCRLIDGFAWINTKENQDFWIKQFNKYKD